MNKILLPILAVTLLFGSYGYNGSTTSAVTLTGGVIKAQHIDSVKKYKRKDCPVCKGTGYYISGDKITKVNCGYCIPDNGDNAKQSSIKKYPNIIIHPPVIIEQNCPNNFCPINNKK